MSTEIKVELDGREILVESTNDVNLVLASLGFSLTKSERYLLLKDIARGKGSITRDGKVYRISYTGKYPII